MEPLTFRRVTVSPTLMECVDAGVEWLNENLPNWRDTIDVDRFNIKHDELCILGQFWQANHVFSVNPFMDAKKCYFDGDWDRTNALGFSTDGSYDELNAAWWQKFDELGMTPNDEEAQG